MKIISILFLLIILASCTAENPPLFNAANLESFYIEVDAEKDTTFRTPKGAFLKIQKGTFSKDVELEIKEAYTMKDILLGGLTTQSNGKPLRTGGMIYVNTRNGEAEAPQKPIRILIPANGIEENMMVFKGEVNKDSINWLPSDTLPGLPEQVVAGKRIFLQNCATCHGIRVGLTGPALAGVQGRGPWKDFNNLVRWVRNPAAFMHNDPYTRDLKNKFGSIMPAYNISPEDLAAVLAFINNESQKTITDTFDRSGYYTADTSDLPGEWRGEGVSVDTLFERDSFFVSDANANLILNSVEFDTYAIVDPSSAGDTLQEPASDGVYAFSISGLGWYNIDAFAEELPGPKLKDLSVEIKGADPAEYINVYAFFPLSKCIVEGDIGDNGKYYFEGIANRLPLVPGEKAIILAFGNNQEQFYYGIRHFNVQPSQNIVVQIKPATREELINAVKNEKIEGISMDIMKQKIKRTDDK